MTTFLIVIIALALIFDYINGFHDAANSIATVVSTKVLTPFQAVLWAAFFNFVAFFIFKDHGVADTVAKTVRPEEITVANDDRYFFRVDCSYSLELFTWWLGIPSSSSHTLIGDLRAPLLPVQALVQSIQLLCLKTAAFIFLAPLVG